MSRVNFPFTAVSGQSLFKTALILAAINPGIGGVLVNGPRGSAKSTLARGFADILPSELQNLVNLPLSATEEMLVGTLDLQSVLSEQKVNFKPGILAKAHQGIVYVDEVNLLADSLVDLLLDVSASGINYIERDGISHQHESRFILLGTMNPEEGELRAQLLDRFGLSVELSAQYSINERVEIVCLREDFDKAPNAFIAKYADQQQQLQQDIANAQASLGQVSCSMALRQFIAQRCHEAHVDGLRADIVWFKTALAHAAWQGHSEVTKTDILAVEDLVLNHRRNTGSSQSPPPPNNNQNKQQPSTPPPFSRPDSSSSRPSSLPEQTGTNTQQQSENSEWGSMPAVSQPMANTQVVELSVKALDAKKKLIDKLILTSKSHNGAVLGGQKISQRITHSPDWFATLVSSLGRWPPAGLRFKKAKMGQPILHMILLDTSGSTLKNLQLSRAKAVIMHIAEQAYKQRELLCIFGFGNDVIETVMPKQKAPKYIQQWLDGITAGGGTPIREMLTQVRTYQVNSQKQQGALAFRNYVLTDGRINQDVDDLKLAGHTLLIDTEDSTIKRGRGSEIAQQLDCEYLVLPA
ncbi:ATP-binding protein [Moritella viscosa]|uniref:Probable magnesium chelatase n=1 Tax=Moritella viscosa TaxID=80854 RepID=A0ABY1HD54_9GAMM|nr:ATP-binding protein [Moritella viscosa]SGY89514.1 Probable magnesium chelatase [Moritella viscosa]SGY97699.1 Probable magnesium chelatase [Moritella viscosa]SHO05769.1 Probable magnesium chelatase [Moritella viscosa]SHO21510.1 Probable magnesium chelatase [Moritella viscosa]SHO25846.1 Probable magnesium chelatase [Moritella viscosa]